MLPDLFGGKPPKDSEEFLDVLERFAEHAKDSFSGFQKSTQAIMEKHQAQHYMAGIKVNKCYNSDSAPSKAMWRFISKIFESKYTDADYKKINGISTKNAP